MAIDISKLNQKQLAALATQVQARIAELQVDKVAKMRDKVMAMITSEGIDYADLMGHYVDGAKKLPRWSKQRLSPNTETPPTRMRHGRGVDVSLDGSLRRSRPVKKRAACSSSDLSFPLNARIQHFDDHWLAMPLLELGTVNGGISA